MCCEVFFIPKEIYTVNAAAKAQNSQVFFSPSAAERFGHPHTVWANLFFESSLLISGVSALVSALPPSIAVREVFGTFFFSSFAEPSSNSAVI